MHVAGDNPCDDSATVFAHTESVRSFEDELTTSPMSVRRKKKKEKKRAYQI